MDWGTYLARGVEKSIVLRKEINESKDIVSLVENYFCSEGLSLFSSKIAVGFLQVFSENKYGILSYKDGRLRKHLKVDIHDLQSGCACIVPKLKAQPFWNTAEFSWVTFLESQYDNILCEFQALRNENIFQPYRAPVTSNGANQSDIFGEMATDKGRWNVCYLFLHGLEGFEVNRSKCPVTVKAIESIPRQYCHSLFSALAPDTTVRPHHGPTNKKLRCHLPLVVPAGSACTLTVGGECRTLEAGKCVIFDDSFLHGASNSSLGGDERGEPRVVLIVDVWHPDLTDTEVKFFSFVDNAKIKALKKYHSLIAAESGSGGVDHKSLPSPADSDADFLSVIQNARQSACSSVRAEDIWKSITS